VKKLDRVIVVNAVKVGMNEIYLTILLFFRYLLIDFRTLTKKSNMGKLQDLETQPAERGYRGLTS